MIGKPALTLLRSQAPRGMSMEGAIQFARSDQATPRDLATIVSRKFRFVLSVTSKSFEPEAPEKPAYQVHRIDTEYGKQPHSSAIGRRAGLALASSSSSNAGGLNSAGEELAGLLTAGETGSSAALSDVSHAPASTSITDSVVGAEAALLQTPPSVAKPSLPSAGKAVADSTVKKALFQESPPRVESESLAEPTAQNEAAKIGLALVAEPDPLAAPDGAALEEKTTTRRRPAPQKNQPEAQSKKKKT